MSDNNQVETFMLTGLDPTLKNGLWLNLNLTVAKAEKFLQLLSKEYLFVFKASSYPLAMGIDTLMRAWRAVFLVIPRLGVMSALSAHSHSSTATVSAGPSGVCTFASVRHGTSS